MVIKEVGRDSLSGELQITLVEPSHDFDIEPRLIGRSAVRESTFPISLYGWRVAFKFVGSECFIKNNEDGTMTLSVSTGETIQKYRPGRTEGRGFHEAVWVPIR